MQNHLTDTHKECLRELLKLVREEAIPEEFHIFYDGDGSPMIIPKDRTSEGFYKIPFLSRLGLEALTRAEFLFSMSRISRSTSGFAGTTSERESEDSRFCYITPEGIRAVETNFSPSEDISLSRPPIEITQSLAKFRSDFPDPSRLAFIMMQFGSGTAHTNILSGIRHAMEPHGFITLRADDKEYHDDLFFNILTYIYGCRFGIAVFERISDDSFNPNVSLEVGYMTGLRKPVCYLKDSTLKTLQSDLIGKLYKEFDAHACDETIPAALWKWMEDRGFLTRRVAIQG